MSIAMIRRAVAKTCGRPVPILTVAAGAFLALFGVTEPAQAQAQKPNIVIIWGDDIGQSNISAY